jgi:hypothetical protein
VTSRPLVDWVSYLHTQCPECEEKRGDPEPGRLYQERYTQTEYRWNNRLNS